MTATSTLDSLTDRTLLDQFGELVRLDCDGNANLLRHIDVIDRRQLWAKLGYPSTFAFLVGRYHMSESTTGKRIGAARTARRFPILFGMVARGEIRLSGIHLLKAHLIPENHEQVLADAKHKTICWPTRSRTATPLPSASERSTRCWLRCSSRRWGSRRSLALAELSPTGRVGSVRSRRPFGAWCGCATKAAAGRCTFVGADGHRCNETRCVEFAHLEPWAKVANIASTTSLCGVGLTTRSKPIATTVLATWPVSEIVNCRRRTQRRGASHRSTKPGAMRRSRGCASM